MVAERPDFLPGELTLDQAAAGDSTLVPLLVAAVIAVAILIPSLGYLFKLVLSGQLDQEFHPIGASDPESTPLKLAGRILLPAVGIAVVGAAVLFFSSATWLEVIGALVLIIGATLIIGSIATPAFLEADGER